MTDELRRVGLGDLKLGDPLPYSVFDRSGTLLLRQGFVITLEKHLRRLIDNGLYRVQGGELKGPATSQAPKVKEVFNVFDEMETVKLRLRRLFEDIKAGVGEDFPDRVMDIAFIVQDSYTRDGDAALASLHLDYHSSYSVVHHLQAALLCEIISMKRGISSAGRITLISAALTHDAGILDIQDDLESEQALSDAQKARIRAHPTRGAEVLRRLGVYDIVWLDAVQHHHERIDGSGYPEALPADKITLPSRILAIADMYSAMVRDRPYRKAMLSHSALKDLLVSQGSKCDPQMIQLMIKEVGVFPPGTLVKLKNGEAAVVTERQDNRACPIVHSFVGANNMPMLTPFRRDTSLPDYAIQGMVPHSQYKSCTAIINSMWQQ